MERFSLRRSGAPVEASCGESVPTDGRRCQLDEVRTRCARVVYPAAAVLSVLALSLDPKQIFDSLSPYGEIGLILIVFAETGLLIGFFLPGDSLLFTAGLLAEQGKLNMAMVLIGCFVAAVVGDQVGFTIGQKAGPAALPAPRLPLLQAGVRRAHGAVLRDARPEDDRDRPLRADRAHVRARPRRRRQMSRRTFFTYNVVGAFIWVVGVTMAGYLLSDVIGEDIDKYLLPIIAAIIILSLIPPFLEWRKAKKHPSHAVSAAEAEAEAAELHEILEEE